MTCPDEARITLQTPNDVIGENYRDQNTFLALTLPAGTGENPY